MVDMPWCLSKDSAETKDHKGVLSQVFHLELFWDVLSPMSSPSAPPTILSMNGQTLTKGVLCGDPCGQKRRYSLKQCKAISLEASMKGELLLIGGRETWLNVIAYWVLAVRFIFVRFFSAPAAGRVICSCFPLCRMLSGVSDNL